MAKRHWRSLSAASLLAFAPSALAQSPPDGLPPAPPDDDAVARYNGPGGDLALAPEAGGDLHTELNRAIAHIARAEYSLARLGLTAALRANGLVADGTSAPAVLLRLIEALRGAPLRPLTPAAPEPTAGAQGGPPPPPTDDEVLSREIDQALSLLAQHHAREARVFLQSALGPATATTEQDAPLQVLLRLATRLESFVPAAPLDADPSAPVAPRTDTVDAVETLTLYTLGISYGLNVGIWADFYVGADRPGLLLAVPLLTAAGGAVGAWLFSRNGELRRGRGYSANTGFYLGGLAGLWLGLDARDSLGTRLRTQGVGNVEILGATAGLGLGVLLGNVTDAQPGSASFVLSGGFWGGAVGVLLGEGLSENPFSGSSRRTEGIFWCVGSLVGAAGAFASARYLDMTPGRTRWIDLGAMLGLTGGMFLPIGNTSRASSSSGASGIGGVIGILAGGIATYFITGLGRDSAPTPRARSGLAMWTPGVAPLPEGGAVFSLRSLTP